MMKRTILLFMLVLLASCGKEPPFDPVAKFKDAEDKMEHFKFEDARKAYQEIQEKAPDRSYDADIMLRIADTYYGEEKYTEAQVEYRAFLNFHPVHRDAPYAQYQIGMCSYNELTTIDRDPAVPRTTAREFQTLLDKYPKSLYQDLAVKYIAECRDRLAEYELYVGRFYYKKESWKAAIGRFEKLARDYAGTPSEKDALYYAGLSYAELGDRAGALRSFATLTTRYPSEAKRVEADVAKLRSLP